MAEHSPSNGESSGGPCTLAVRNGVATVTLNRPEIHNAFDETLIATLTETFVTLDDDRDVRVVVLAGAGRSFCAGADLNWMKRMAAFGDDENLRDATALAAMLRALYALSKPTIARVHGAAYGGASA
jgi:methylglutaconyl-CoA hydratase